MLLHLPQRGTASPKCTLQDFSHPELYFSVQRPLVSPSLSWSKLHSPQGPIQSGLPLLSDLCPSAVPATLASFMLLPQTKHVFASGPLHLLLLSAHHLNCPMLIPSLRPLLSPNIFSERFFEVKTHYIKQKLPAEIKMLWKNFFFFYNPCIS